LKEKNRTKKNIHSSDEQKGQRKGWIILIRPNLLHMSTMLLDF